MKKIILIFLVLLCLEGKILHKKKSRKLKYSDMGRFGVNLLTSIPLIKNLLLKEKFNNY